MLNLHTVEDYDYAGIWERHRSQDEKVKHWNELSEAQRSKFIASIFPLMRSVQEHIKEIGRK